MIRMSRILPTILAAVLALGLYVGNKPAESHAEPTTPASPTVTLPMCPSNDETGAGMALCMWDAGSMGNGEGTSMVSGDCALVGNALMELCIELHDTQDGADSVMECNDIQNEIDNGIAKREPGWDLENCFKAMMGM